MAEKLTLDQARKRVRVSRRQLAFLVRTGVIDANFEDGDLYITDSELRRYRDEPREIAQKHHASYLGPWAPDSSRAPRMMTHPVSGPTHRWARHTGSVWPGWPSTSSH